MNSLFTILLCGVVALPLCAKTPKAPGQTNLIPNGSLEQGSGRTPQGWSKLDGISSLWTTGGKSGKCITLKTDVLQLDKQDFIKSEQDFLKHPPRKGAKNQYDTVGAHEGAWAFAPPYDIQPGDNCFILSADVLAPAKSSELFFPQILIRGYKKITAENAGKDKTWFHDHFQNGVFYSDVFGSKTQQRNSQAGDFLMVYRHSLVCRCTKINQFIHFEMGFKLPAMKKFRPERLLFKCYAIWPVGSYKFDNITLRRATPEEVKAVNDARPSIQELKQ